MKDKEKRDLMLRFAAENGGKWPDDRYISVLIATKYNVNYKEGSFYVCSATTDHHYSKTSWDFCCTRDEFEALIQELAEGVPAGATHFDYMAKSYPWYKKEGEALYHISDYGLQPCDPDTSGLIPLPKIEPKKWMPEVGGNALLLNDEGFGLSYGEHLIGKEVAVCSIFKNSIGVELAAVEYEEATYCFRLSMLHKPKTEAEKEREAGIKTLTEILAKGVGDCEPDEYLATQIWDAGYRLTEK